MYISGRIDFGELKDQNGMCVKYDFVKGESWNPITVSCCLAIGNENGNLSACKQELFTQHANGVEFSVLSGVQVAVSLGVA